MKKISLIIVFIVMGLTSCDGSGWLTFLEKLKEEYQEQQVQVLSKEDILANEVMAYYKEALKNYRNYNDSYINQGIDYLKSADKYIATETAGERAIKPFKPVFMMNMPATKGKLAPEGFGSNRELIDDTFEEMIKSANIMRKLINETVLYIDAEDYKDDNGKLLHDNRKTADAEAQAFGENAIIYFNAMKPYVQKYEEKMIK